MERPLAGQNNFQLSLQLFGGVCICTGRALTRLSSRLCRSLISALALFTSLQRHKGVVCQPVITPDKIIFQLSRLCCQPVESRAPLHQAACIKHSNVSTCEPTAAAYATRSAEMADLQLASEWVSRREQFSLAGNPFALSFARATHSTLRKIMNLPKAATLNPIQRQKERFSQTHCQRTWLSRCQF